MSGQSCAVCWDACRKGGKQRQAFKTAARHEATLQQGTSQPSALAATTQLKLACWGSPQQCVCSFAHPQQASAGGNCPISSVAALSPLSLQRLRARPLLLALCHAGVLTAGAGKA